MRDIVFISHANPEDNEFTLWLALQLAREGYPVWCDLTQLLGGEDFWKDAEGAIRDRTAKLIFVLSKTSNRKDGPLKELRVAQNVAKKEKLKDFVIPCRVDDLPHSDINIELARLIAIDFRNGWAKGLNDLLAKLDGDKVSKNVNFTPDAVTSWWRTQFATDKGVVNQTVEHLSNWFPLSLPEHIYVHELSRNDIGLIELPEELPYPALQYKTLMISFAPAGDFEGTLAGLFIKTSWSFVTSSFLAGTKEPRLKSRDITNFVVELFSLAWDQFVQSKKLLCYQLANEKRAYYFTLGVLENDKIAFVDMEGKKRHRDMVGYKTIKKYEDGQSKRRFWHFSVEARPMLNPVYGFQIKYHVIFSDDGKNIWESKDRLHRARRSQCKEWWNAAWRDRTLAVMSWLADGDETMKLKIGAKLDITVAKFPLTFNSPVFYVEPDKYEPPPEGVGDDKDEEEEEANSDSGGNEDEP